jgi:hypothetical protein
MESVARVVIAQMVLMGENLLVLVFPSGMRSPRKTTMRILIFWFLRPEWHHFHFSNWVVRVFFLIKVLVRVLNSPSVLVPVREWGGLRENAPSAPL